MNNNSGNIIYGLGLIGAIIFYLQRATTFQQGIIGVLKALAWPAFVVYEVLGFLNL